MFSDICGFVEFVSTALPMQVIQFLNEAHGQFDVVISPHNVYKVETIGDSYLVRLKTLIYSSSCSCNKNNTLIGGKWLAKEAR